MTAETDLLPLYAELQGHPKIEIIKHYARACVAHATAPLQAEIEALRAEVEEWKSVACAQAELHDEAEECAEELAKALAGLITWIPSADTYRRLGFDPEAPMRALERAKLALGRGGLSDD